MSYHMVNKVFSELFNVNYDNFIVMYTDVSFFIPELHITLTNNIPPLSPSFTAECYAIIEALTLILNLASNRYLIASDSKSCLQSLNSNPFKFH